MARILGCVLLALQLGAPETIDIPRAIRVVGMDYPPLALAARVEGTVRVRCHLDQQGNVVSAERLEPPASRMDPLGEGARTNALRWKFTSSNDQRRGDSIELSYVFAIETKSGPPFRSNFIYDAPQSVYVTGEIPPMQVD